MAADLLDHLTGTTSYYPFQMPPIGSSGQQPDIEVSDYIGFGDIGPMIAAGSQGSSIASEIMELQCGSEQMKRMKVGVGCRIGFRTRSEVEVLDDGFKWRKYGKKSVKNSPNPRNYYRCSSEGCGVKKRVERDREDPCYVITTYEGIHNHTSPSASCHHGATHHQIDASSWVSFGSGQVQLVDPNDNWTEP